MAQSDSGREICRLIRMNLEQQIEDYKTQMCGVTGERRAEMRRELRELYGVRRRMLRVEAGRLLKSHMPRWDKRPARTFERPAHAPVQ